MSDDAYEVVKNGIKELIDAIPGEDVEAIRSNIKRMVRDSCITGDRKKALRAELFRIFNV